MGPVNRKNLERVKLFSLEEYVKKIKLESNILEHVQDTSEQFDKYMELLLSYPDYVVSTFLVESFRNEFESSNLMENHFIHPLDISANNIFFNNLGMSNKRIKELHQFALDDEKLGEYRSGEACVGYMDKLGNKNVYWYGAEAEDIQNFMNQFIEIYKDNSLSLIHSNPFLKSALVSLLFVRIHPFGDGNGRTARLLYELKFTELVNKIKSSRLRVSPLHISAAMLINQLTYVNCLDDIYFDLEHDSNYEINRWFDFCLNMSDEQIYYLSNFLNQREKVMMNTSLLYEKNPKFYDESLEKMRLTRKKKNLSL